MHIKGTPAILLATAALTLVYLAPVSAAGETAGDLRRQVERAVVRYVYFTVFDDVAVEIDRDGGVILRGHVTSPHKRTELVRRVAAMGSVDRVHDDLEVLPPSRLDDSLRYRVARSIYGSSTFWHYAARRNPPIHIIVNRGHVTLTGNVNDETEKIVAGVLASSSGAFSLRNELEVTEQDPPGSR